MERPDAERRYSDKEVARILERATRIQAAGSGDARAEGMTLAELRDVAVEAGIDPAFLSIAAAEIEEGPSTLSRRLLGGPLRISLERRIPGVLPAELLDTLIPMIQSAADAPGQASAVGDTLTWSSNAHGNTRSLQVLVGPADDDTTLVRLQERVGGLAGGLYGGIVGGLGGGVGFGVGGALGGLLGSAAFGLGVPAVALAGSYGAARFLFGRAVQRRRQALVGLADRLAAEIARHHRGTGEASSRLSAPRKHLTPPAEAAPTPDGDQPLHS